MTINLEAEAAPREENNTALTAVLDKRGLREVESSCELEITIICPVVGGFIARNPEYLGLIDRVHPGAGAYPSTSPRDARATCSSPRSSMT